MPERIDTFDVWTYIKFVKERERDLYIRVVDAVDPMKVYYVALADLPPQRWVYWVYSWWMDRLAPIKTMQEWKELDNPDQGNLFTESEENI
jgi:hypothetical protein